ncbi:hypothetical protein [Alkalilacustris brevis]|uniref:hypothetical protein n=1 Tax=Alkalilacustris brevis TaxID=2026338 RepID=UPI001EE43D87|nr:hypothetical protein [Alkalilacustris brevis]
MKIMRPLHRRLLGLMTGLALAVSPTLSLSGAGEGAAWASEEGDTSGMNEGLGLIEEGARLILRGLMDEMDPLFDELEKMIDDLTLYHRPEILPNGDIILRRRVPLEPDEPPQGEGGTQPDEEIDI